jgi:putative endonuclease
MEKHYYTYILASKRNGTLYVGVTSDLIKRVYQHRKNLVDGFTSKYQVHRLVYYEQYRNVLSAIQREKRLKEWQRKWKLALIEKHNPEWRDFYPDITESRRSDDSGHAAG